MEPQDTHIFEYTYRPSELIKNFFAGPKYWKFLENSKTCTRRKAKKRTHMAQIQVKKRKLSKKVKISELRAINDSLLWLCKSVKGPAPFKRFRYDAFTLPFDYNISNEIFQGFSNSSVSLNDPICNDIDCYTQSMDEVENGLDDTDDIFDRTDLDRPASKSKWNLLSFNKFNIKHRSIDLARIKNTMLGVIQKETNCGIASAKFLKIYSKVATFFQESDISFAITFFVVLQAACEKKVVLCQQNWLDDFNIFYMLTP